MKLKTIIAIIFTASLITAQTNRNPLEVAKSIADKVIHDTPFILNDVIQKPVEEIQVVDFENAGLNSKNGFAFAKIISEKDGIFKFGISYSSPFKINVNDKTVINKKKKTKFFFHEIAYSMFVFNDTISIELKSGINNIYIKSSTAKGNYIYLRQLTEPQEEASLKFIPIRESENNSTWPWCFVSKDKISDKSISSLFETGSAKNIDCIYPVPNKLKTLEVPEDAAFKRDAYSEWNYANGALMMVLSDLTTETNDQTYRTFVKRVCDFTYSNMLLFSNQYYEKHAFRGTDHRIFRRSMLDDAGAPTLPYLELELVDNNNKYDTLVQSMADYVLNKQVRLQDGTLCRPEPQKWSIWADDLFMAVPYLLRMGKLTNEEKYYDEAAKQIINFNKYLFDKDKQIYKHGWFSSTNSQSAVHWGRANGWLVWAVSEALIYLPKDHPDYNKIKEIYIVHLMGLLKYQDGGGMWHQVLDDSTSFLETSCTSMYILGLCRAIENGFIDKSYSANIEKAWNALQQNISNDGIVKDICCGTDIGFNADYYKNRKRYENDPRGLGAVLTAAMEVHKLRTFLNK